MRRSAIYIMFTTAMLIASSLFLTGFGGDVEMANAGPATRDTGETLYVQNGTTVIDITSGGEMLKWNSIVFRDDGKLVIRGVLVIAQNIICESEYRNTSFVMEPQGDEPAKLTVQSGILDVKADEISITDSTISVTNETEIPGNGDEGKDSSIQFLSEKTDLILNGSSISITGQTGGNGVNSNGGNGGKAYLTLSTQGSNDVIIKETEINVFGGKGGDTFSPGFGSGSGGQVICDIKGRGVEIGDSTIYAKSGDAGAAGVSSFGKSGGFCQMFIESRTSDMILQRTNLEAIAGTSSSDQVVLSQIKLTTLSGAITWDEGKTGDAKYVSQSSWKADNLQTEASEDAVFYQVDIGESDNPAPLSGTHLSIYWWANVIVRDNTGSPMEGVGIRYFDIQDSTTRYPLDGPVFTDEEGEVLLEVEGFKDLPATYTFRAEDQGGAEASSDRIRFITNTNMDVNIDLTTITIERSGPVGNVIGGLVRFQGTAISGGQANVVSRVDVYMEDQVLGSAEDKAPQGGLPFSTWEFVWDSTSVADDFYTFNFIAQDNAYQAVLSERLEVNQEVIAHPPELNLVTITDPLGIYEVAPGDITEIHVNQNDNMIDFEVRVFDVDYRSEFIDLGKEMVSAEVRLVYQDTGDVVLTRVLDEFQTVNESGGFRFNFQIDSSKKPGTSDALDDGIYRVEMDIVDDAGFYLESQFIKFELFFDYYPNAYAFIDAIDGSRISPELVPGVDVIVDYEAFRLSTDKSDTVKVRFNLTRSTDQDSPRFGSSLSWQDLTFTFRVKRIGSGEPEKIVVDSQASLTVVEYEFDVEDVDGDETGNFDIWVDVADKDGLQDTVRYMVRIEHDPPEKRVSLLEDLTGVGAFSLLEADLMSIVYPVLLIVMVGVYLGLFFFISFKFNADRKKKLELIERKRKDDQDLKKDTSIDDEVSGTYMKTSQKYLESTGATKGKDDFTRELQAASGSSPAKSGPVQPQQTAAAPPQPQQAAVQKTVAPAPVVPQKPSVPAAPQGPPQPPTPAVPPAPPAAPPAPPGAPPVPPQPKQ